MKKQLLIVDGYNMIGSWPELVQLKKQDKMADMPDHMCAGSIVCFRDVRYASCDVGRYCGHVGDTSVHGRYAIQST